MLCQKDTNREKRILLIRGGGLGDFILSIPVIQALRIRWPEKAIDVMGHKRFADLGRAVGLVDRVFSIDGSDLHLLFREQQRDQLEKLSISKFVSSYDLVVSFLADEEGVFESNLKDLVANTCFISPPNQLKIHASVQFLMALEPLGVRPPEGIQMIALPQETLLTGERRLKTLMRGPASQVIAIHPGSGSKQKNWPRESYQEIIHMLEEESDCSVLLVSGEEDANLCQRIMEALKRPVPVAESLPIVELAAVLAHCRIFLGNDSGPGHLAALVGIPVVALFGPTVPEIWSPLGPHVEVIDFKNTSPENLFTRLVKRLILNSYK